MKKYDIAKKITKNIEKIEAGILKTYGVCSGVGYDLMIYVAWGHTSQFETLKAHANRMTWAGVGHLRPSNPMYQYTGHNNYAGRVIEYWEQGGGMIEYLQRLRKSDLMAFAKDRGIALND